MESFIFSINAVLPIFLLIFIGYFLSKVKVVDEKFSNIASRLVFMAALPALMFLNVSKSDFSGLFRKELLKVIIYAILVTLISFVSIMIYARKKIVDEKSRAAFIQGAFRGNYALLGIPLIYNIASDEGVVVASMISAFTIPLYNVLAIVVLSIHKKINAMSLMKTIIKNPLIISIIAGIIVSALDIDFPKVVDETIRMVSVIAIPLALISIGVFFDFGKFMIQLKTALLASLIKTVMIPVIFTPIAYLIGIRGIYLVSVYVLFAAPSAVSSYIMAKEMDADHEMASCIIILSTAISLITIFLGIYFMKSIGLI